MYFRFYLFLIVNFCLFLSCKNGSSSDNRNQIDSLKISGLDTIQKAIVEDDTTSYDSSLYFNDNIITDTVIAFRYSDIIADDTICPFFFDFKDTITRKTINSIDIVLENPYVKEGCELISKGSHFGFHKAKLPGKGNKKALYKLLSNDVMQFIPDSVSYPVGYCEYRIDISANKFALVGYSLNLSISDKGYPGFGGSRIAVYNSSGKRIYSHKVNGILSLEPSITFDGKYLTIVFTKKPYWIQPQEVYFQIIRLRDNKIVFQNVYDRANDSDMNWLDVKRNMIVSSFLESRNRTLLCLDSDKNMLYIKQGLPSSIYIRNWIRDYIYLDIENKPSQKLFFDKDFEVIHL